MALSYNHRASAFYRADSEQGDNSNVAGVRLRGLKRVRVLASWTPEVVFKFLATAHNRYHQGSGASVVELCETALSLGASWRQSCEHTGMTYNNPRYQKCYEVPPADVGHVAQCKIRVRSETVLDSIHDYTWCP